MEGKKDIIEKLKREIDILQGYKPATDESTPDFGLNPITDHFPTGRFPTGAVHEFVTPDPESDAASNAFLCGLLSVLLRKGGHCVWVGTSRTLFPPALVRFGVEPDRIIFIDVQLEKQVLWVTEEALKCTALSGVVAELRDLDFNQSRRLQLACERSSVTAFIKRSDPSRISTTAAAARWAVTHQPSRQKRRLPGIGFPHWQVELQRVRNGSPGRWQVEWTVDRFAVLPELVTHSQQDIAQRNVG